jgi:hypothetical protein
MFCTETKWSRAECTQSLANRFYVHSEHCLDEYTKHARTLCTQIGLNPNFLFKPIWAEKARPCLVNQNWYKWKLGDFLIILLQISEVQKYMKLQNEVIPLFFLRCLILRLQFANELIILSELKLSTSRSDVHFLRHSRPHLRHLVLILKISTS